MPLVLKYYLPNFDPRNTDDAELDRTGRDWLARAMGFGVGADPAGARTS